MSALRNVLDPWLGKPQWKQTGGRVTFVYRFDSEDAPPLRLRLKVEINSREHFSVYGVTRVPFSVSSRWFAGDSEIGTYALDELLATKMRALYQRKKSRDLFDLAVALGHGKVDPGRIVAAFLRYMDHGGHRISRAEFERNIEAKLRDPQFNGDIGPLLATGMEWDSVGAAARVHSQLLARLPGEPWQGKP
jgi:predicted nucleotidyltransferase component of viral defense system